MKDEDKPVFERCLDNILGTVMVMYLIMMFCCWVALTIGSPDIIDGIVKQVNNVNVEVISDER